MTIFKKTLSVFMAAVMLCCVMSVGLVGIAAGIDYNTQYNALADALKNDYVRELTNYTISNNTLQDGESRGFNVDANGFAYEHRVTAQDNAAGDILKAANIFYFIAENLISTTNGVGCYDADTLVKEIERNVKTRFNDSDETYYEDFYGNRYEPKPDELAAYEKAVSLIEATGRELSQASLTALNIYFMEKDYYEYYNVSTILKYFVGNTLKINAGNWYHRFSFVVQTSVDTCLKECDGINNIPDSKFAIRTGVYEFAYARTFNETQARAYYAFKMPSLKKVYDDYRDEFDFTSSASADLSKNRGLTATGQAAYFFIDQREDTTTIPDLLAKYAMFEPYITAGLNANDAAWDAQFASMNETQLATAVPNASAIVNAMEELTSTYSNDALLAMFGDNIGNMITLTYILKPISQSPTRIVRDGARYTATADKLNAIVRDMDALVYDDTSDTSKRVGTIVSQFFNTNNSLFEGTSVEGMEYTDLNELVKHLVTGLLFRDSIVNMLVELLYPMIVELIQNELIAKVADAVGTGLGNIVDDLLSNIIEQNDLAIYPEDLAARINNDYPNKFTEATAVLSKAGHYWENVNFDAIKWGVDDASYTDKAELFIDALCAGLGGFVRAVVTVMCGDAEFSENIGLSYDKDQFDTYFDKKLINILGITGWLRSQGGYSKLIVPLFRVLGIPEMSSGATYSTTITGYVTPEDYHRIIASKDSNGNYRYGYSLRLILAPIVYWVENILAERPFETIWDLIPNLVYFFTRQGTSVVSLADIKAHNTSETRDADSSHGGRFNDVNGMNEWQELGTYNLYTILDTVDLLIDITVPILFNKNFTINIDSIAGLIDKDTLLSSVNGLLSEVLDFEYVVGESGILNTVAYKSADGEIVMPDSYEYGINPEKYPIALTEVYANENETSYTEFPDDEHPEEHKITNPEYIKAPYRIPQLQEAKLTSVTTVGADGKLVDPNAIGVLNTEWNTIDVRNPGVVLMYVLRFVISALGYKYDISDTAADTELPFLIECFGLELDNELFQGLNLKDIIFNVMLHPDEAICALLELFYSNEDGNKYLGKNYTYSMTPIRYHEDVLLNKEINPGLAYGTNVRYTKYWTREYATDTLDNAGELAENILSMLGVEGFEGGFGPFIENLLNEKVFTDDLMNTLFNTIYQLLGGLNKTVGFDIEKLLDAALNVTYSPSVIGKTLEAMAGPSPASNVIKNAVSWNDLFKVPGTEATDPETGEVTFDIGDIELDWNIDNAAATENTSSNRFANTPRYKFLQTAAALLAPAAFVIRFLFMDQHLDILGLIDIDSYAGYQYAWIGLLEALSCPQSSILTYDEYYEKGQEKIEGTLVGDANTIYYLLSPVLGLVDELITGDTLTLVLDLIPNLLFFISIGGLNDLLNNFVHFAYVLLDILKPIVNGYDLLNGLISNISIGSMTLNLTLPLDLDFNALISDLVDSLVGDSLTIEGVRIALPYIDFHTLCCGQLAEVRSQEIRQIVRLDSAGGADLITAVLRLAFEILFMQENKDAVSQILVNLIGEDENGNPKLDELDKHTMFSVLDELFNLLQTYEVPDMLLCVVYFLVTKLTPVSTKLAVGLRAQGINIKELFGSVSDDPMGFVTTLVSVLGLKEETPTEDPDVIKDPEAAKGMFSGFINFWKRIIAFFKKLFGIA